MSSQAATFARQTLVRAAQTLQATTKGTQEPLGHLQALRHARWLLNQAEILMIEAARSEGRSWASIARARGTTRQAERQAHLRRVSQEQREPLDRWIDGQRERWREVERQRVGSRCRGEENASVG